VAYLGHMILLDDVVVDQLKVQAILDWPLPQTVKAVRTFLGLTGYYHQFIKNYGMTTFYGPWRRRRPSVRYNVH
jgi:hypothetical protein